MNLSRSLPLCGRELPDQAFSGGAGQGINLAADSIAARFDAIATECGC
ncbi:MAG TPA: hypothetical protein VGG26_08235 [Terracidiphilus sp.]|jgi:hypothetical protein